MQLGKIRLGDHEIMLRRHRDITPHLFRFAKVFLVRDADDSPLISTRLWLYTPRWGSWCLEWKRGMRAHRLVRRLSRARG